MGFLENMDCEFLFHTCRMSAWDSFEFEIHFLTCSFAVALLTKVVNSVLVTVLVYPLEQNISVPIKSDIPYWDCH